MLRAVTKLLSLATVVGIGLVIVFIYLRQTASERHTAELETQNQELKQVVDRLTDERRVAQMLVTGKKMVNGLQQTSLLFMESSRTGGDLPPKSFTIEGNDVHLDAMVIKFQRDFVKQNDPLRGHSIALFTKIYGNHQSPDTGSTVDTPGKIPDFYQGANPQVSAFELQLWTDFWKLAKDAAYRDRMGVRVSNGQGLWWPCEADQLYTISIESDGGLNVTSELVKGIYREALRQMPAVVQ